jgi:mono/diheme cytochrome c family protein
MRPIRHSLLLYLILTATLCWPLVLVASAQEGTAGPSAPPSPEVATSIYEERCALCHGPAGQGDGARAIEVNLSMPDLTDPAIFRETTPARWFDIISNGVADEAMPPFGDASSNPLRQIDRWNLVFYLYTLNTPPEQVAMGQALYDSSCAECHEPDGAGSADGSAELAEVAPGFTDLATMATLSQADLFAAIADTTVEGHDLGFGEVEIWAVADYVRTFSYIYTPPRLIDIPFAADPFAGGEGVVTGRVINGTAGAAPPAGLEVRLRAFDMNAAFLDAITTTVAADGSFLFEGIDPAAPVQLEPLAVYRDIPYFGDLDGAIVLSPVQPQADVNITVYETTEDASSIRLERLHLVFDLASNQAQVAELYILFSREEIQTVTCRWPMASPTPSLFPPGRAQPSRSWSTTWPTTAN